MRNHRGTEDTEVSPPGTGAAGIPGEDQRQLALMQGSNAYFLISVLFVPLWLYLPDASTTSCALQNRV